MKRRTTARRATALLLAGGVLVGGTTATAAAATTTPAPTSQTQTPPSGHDEAKAPPPEDTLGAHDRQLLADAEAEGVAAVTVLLATREGGAEGVDAAVEDLGGTVGYRDDELGYVRARVPTANVLKAAGLRDVVAVDLDELVPLPEPVVEQGRRGERGAVPAPGPRTPAANPYLPTDETGAVAFTKANPTWDGRGTTIGVIDSGVDLDHPALQQTTTGERKIVDWVTATDPLLEGDGTWRPMVTAVSGPQFSYQGATWTAPAGDLRVSTFREAITERSDPAGDVNRDGDTTDVWGVLYRPGDHAIWVDVDQDRDFTDEELMRPYREAFQVGHFGTDDPATAVAETVPFVVEHREDVDLSPLGGANVGRTADFVNIGLTESSHGTHVAGIAAARDLYGGTADGAAPGAKIVSSRACTWGGGCTAVALTEGMIDLVANRGVDVVNMSIGGLPALNDGANSRATLYDRLIERYGVQIFISAGNSGPGLNTVGDPSVASDVVSVGSSISRATWRANYGSVVSADQQLHNFSSRGPREDGGAKPNLVAPGSAVSTTPRWIDEPDVAETGYSLPVGLEMFNGTSMASPQAAGAAALLLSAAEAKRVPVTPAQLRRSLYSSTRFLPRVPAYGQGNGLVDVGGAWKVLRQQPEVQEYTVSAPVCTELSAYLETPGAGAGVYNRCEPDQGGHVAGQAKTYPVTITRTSGRQGSIEHRISWLSDDDTFRAPRSVRLPLGKPVTVEVRATPGPDAHAAVMRLDDPATAAVDTEVFATVVASAPLAAPSWTATQKGVVERNRNKRFFVAVPEGAQALQVDLAGLARGSQTRFIAYNPYGVPVESTSSLACYANFSDPAECDPTSRAYPDPVPGVWEVEVESRRTSPLLENPYRLSAAVQGLSVEPEEVVLDGVALGEPARVEWSVTNAFGPVVVTPEGGPLGSARTARGSIEDGATAESTVEVPEGAASLSVSIGAPSDPSADLDLYVLLDGEVVGQSADGDSEESVVLTDPAPGAYTVLVDAYAVPEGSTEYDVRDVFTAEALGSLSVPDAPITLAAGQRAGLTGTVEVLAAPAEGRQLLGRVVLRSAAGADLGSGTVVVARAGG